jgi:hypothetical protein
MPKDQHPARLHTTWKLFSPDKEEDGHSSGHLFCLSLSFFFSVFTPFTANVTRALPLEAIKGEGQGPEQSRTTEPNRKETTKQQQLEPT